MTPKRAAFLLTLLLAAPAAAAGPSPTLLYTGRLSDVQGRPLDGTYLLEFRLYEAGATRPAWSESSYVKAQAGRFTATLGSRAPLPGAVLEGGYRLEAAAPAGTDWTARPEGQPRLEA
ncbi:MAG: hypothetical protein KGL53_11855, partial [Elusimicrobia bacterium]|nr:hypothetical protein [Elusimicrobiota bacterium]